MTNLLVTCWAKGCCCLGSGSGSCSCGIERAEFLFGGVLALRVWGLAGGVAKEHNRLSCRAYRNSRANLPSGHPATAATWGRAAISCRINRRTVPLDCNCPATQRSADLEALHVYMRNAPCVNMVGSWRLRTISKLYLAICSPPQALPAHIAPLAACRMLASAAQCPYDSEPVMCQCRRSTGLSLCAQ